MFTYIISIAVLFITIIQCQDVPVSFPTFPSNTDIGTCTCDLTGNKCDISCCCDPDCSAADQTAFACSSRANQYTNSTPVISSVQPTCFKNISIFNSNSPYIIQKMGELVCIDYQRYSGSQYYQQPNIQTLNSAIFLQAINAENSVTAPLDSSTSRTNYQVGTPMLIYDTPAAVPGNYFFPRTLFTNGICSGSQPITYMNDFASTCNQLVTQDTCNDTLNPLTYISPLCVIQSPSNSSVYICDNTTATGTSFTSGTGSCSNALQSLTIIITYLNPIGIVNVRVSYATAIASSSTPFPQTFTVQFINNGSTSTGTSPNPGYLQDAAIVTSTANGSVIQTSSSSQFSIFQVGSTGFCDVTAGRRPIRFGENVRSTCKYNLTSTTSCPNLYNLFMPINSTYLYVAAYSNSNSMNITGDWLPVISCISDIGNINSGGCTIGIFNSSSSTLCYIRLDIQIAYTNIGSINNPQCVLSAVIFNYQGVTLPFSNTTTTILIRESVTFQDISPTPIVIQGQIPLPSTRLPANFFYPFSVSQATTSKTFSLLSCLFISLLLIFM